jgi:hypothetical protein
MRSIAVALVALTACTGGTSVPEKTPEEIELDGARTMFQQNMPADYSFHWRESCECTQETAAEMLITVTNGSISSAIYVETEQAVPAGVRSRLVTIDGVFDKIQDAIDEDAHAITIEYDTELGFPKSVAIDYDAQVADEELSLTISDVVPLSECGFAPCG